MSGTDAIHWAFALAVLGGAGFVLVGLAYAVTDLVFKIRRGYFN